MRYARLQVLNLSVFYVFCSIQCSAQQLTAKNARSFSDMESAQIHSVIEWAENIQHTHTYIAIMRYRLIAIRQNV